MKYRVFIKIDEDGKFIAECPTLPGCVSQGDTQAEAMSNISDAINGYIESLKRHGDQVPPSTWEGIVEVES